MRFLGEVATHTKKRLWGAVHSFLKCRLIESLELHNPPIIPKQPPSRRGPWEALRVRGFIHAFICLLYCALTADSQKVWDYNWVAVVALVQVGGGGLETVHLSDCKSITPPVTFEECRNILFDHFPVLSDDLPLNSSPAVLAAKRWLDNGAFQHRHSSGAKETRWRPPPPSFRSCFTQTQVKNLCYLGTKCVLDAPLDAINRSLVLEGIKVGKLHDAAAKTALADAFDQLAEVIAKAKLKGGGTLNGTKSNNWHHLLPFLADLDLAARDDNSRKVTSQRARGVQEEDADAVGDVDRSSGKTRADTFDAVDALCSMRSRCDRESAEEEGRVAETLTEMRLVEVGEVVTGVIPAAVDAACSPCSNVSRCDRESAEEVGVAD